ncbi:MAG: PRC-barrel domain-containing protein [Thermoplasmata archaeon]|nr:PRC-barrel domain-containing protein [Thermoplasmata archaeon]
MLELVTDLIGLPVYTKEGIYLGDVNNVVLDVTNNRINGLFVSNTNPTLVEESANLNIPYRWVQSVGDIINLKYFPPRVTLRRETTEAEEYDKYKW